MTPLRFLPILAALALVGCGEKPTPQGKIASEQPGAKDRAKAELPTVVNFDKKSTPAGTPFNVQVDGNSGISFELSRAMPAAEFRGWFDGKPLSVVVNQGIILTSTIPNDYIETPGEYPIELEVHGRRLPVGTFVVEPVKTP